jgi:NAD-dependent protein deacetylase/lipoamidase
MAKAAGLCEMRVLVITGAGISAESGIPTFRGKEGYWRKLDPMTLATPEAFARDPELVWEWYRERRGKIRAAQPNAAHQALVRLATLSRDFLLVTQNVDDLHARAEFEAKRISKNRIVQIHGDIFLTRCSRCEFRKEDPPSSDSGVAGEPENAEYGEEVPNCPECGGLMRPGVVWFGESLDLGKIETVENYLGRGPCDLVMVIGTTALFGYIVDWAVRARGTNGGLIEVNPDETSLSSFATRLVREPAAVALPRLVSELCV